MTETAAAAALRRYNRDRQRAIRAGTWEGLHDPTEVIRHIDALRAAGMSARSIAIASGVSLPTISALAWPDHSHARKRGVLPVTARAILAVTVSMTPPDGLINPAGTVRRIRALAVMGWSSRRVAEEAGVPRQTITGMSGRRGIHRSTADAVADVYDRLSMRRGPDRKAAALARNAGWAPPLAWDDDSIDDPTAAPCTAPCDGDVVDEIAIARAIAGTPTTLTPAERLEVVKALAARGLSDAQIAACCRVSDRTVERDRIRHSIPSTWRSTAA